MMWGVGGRIGPGVPSALQEGVLQRLPPLTVRRLHSLRLLIISSGLFAGKENQQQRSIGEIKKTDNVKRKCSKQLRNVMARALLSDKRGERYRFNLHKWKAVKIRE